MTSNWPQLTDSAFSQIPVKTLPTLKEINTPAQLAVVCKPMEGALNSLVVEIINKDQTKSTPTLSPREHL